MPVVTLPVAEEELEAWRMQSDSCASAASGLSQMSSEPSASIRNHESIICESPSGPARSCGSG